jgi:hypothetical protein
MFETDHVEMIVKSEDMTEVMGVDECKAGTVGEAQSREISKKRTGIEEKLHGASSPYRYLSWLMERSVSPPPATCDIDNCRKVTQ